MMLLSILIPVLGRPGNAQKVVDSIRANTTVDHAVFFLVTPGDDAEREAVNATGCGMYGVANPSGRGDYAKKINFGFNITTSPYVFTAADDVTFTPGWDTAVLEVAERTGAGMVGTNDDANPLVKRGRHSTHSLFSRRYVNTVGGTFFDGPGVVYHEGYDHQWIDTEAVRAAMDRGEWAFAHNSLVAHHHPIYDRTVAMDDTYRRALGDASADKRLFTERLKRWSVSRR